jgi:SAM-dependent methyltransferase
MSALPSAVNARLHDLEPILASPVDGAPLRLAASGFVGARGDSYPVAGNVPDFYVDEHQAGDAVTRKVGGFYEEKPFPNYEGIDDREQLRRKARATVFASLLDAQLPKGATILEAGCGTGQLTNYLAMSPWRRVVGGDLSSASLRLAEDFRERFEINNAAFLRMNIFRMPFKPASFDVIISNGVLHHTRDARAAFGSLVEKLKPGGLVVIGLYNYYARIPTLARRAMGRHNRELAILFDAHLKKLERGTAKFEAWYADQYLHPKETRHSQDEVLRWFAEEGVEFLSAIPSLDGKPFDPALKLFEPHSTASGPTRVLSQLQMLLENAGDGGLFIMIGRRKP